MKACVYILFQILPWIVHVGDWALRWTEGNEALQVIFVMLFFPLIMNALQYYIIDGFIKGKKSPEGHEPLPGEDPSAGDDSGLSRSGVVPPSANAWDASFESEDEVDGLKNGNERARLMKPAPKVKVEDGQQEYDPELDGESDSPASGSSSRQVRREGDRTRGQRRS